MRPKDHQLPESGPGSNPVLFGIAHGLSEMFPPIELSPIRYETDERIEEEAAHDDERHEPFA